MCVLNFHKLQYFLPFCLKEVHFSSGASALLEAGSDTTLNVAGIGSDTTAPGETEGSSNTTSSFGNVES